MRRRTLLSLASATAMGGALAACGSAVTGEDPATGGGESGSGTVRVGHLPSDAMGVAESPGRVLWPRAPL